MAKFILRSDFLSTYKNMIIKQQVSDVTIQEVCHLHYGIFHFISFYLCHTLSILLYRSPVLLTKK